MPYSKNYPNPLCIWVSDETKKQLDGVAKVTGAARTRIVRRSIRMFNELYEENPEKWRKYLICEENECPPISS